MFPFQDRPSAPLASAPTPGPECSVPWLTLFTWGCHWISLRLIHILLSVPFWIMFSFQDGPKPCAEAQPSVPWLTLFTWECHWISLRLIHILLLVPFWIMFSFQNGPKASAPTQSKSQPSVPWLTLFTWGCFFWMLQDFHMHFCSVTFHMQNHFESLAPHAWVFHMGVGRTHHEPSKKGAEIYAFAESANG